MKTISVKASRNYDVIIGDKLLDKVGEYIAPIKANKVLIISDSVVFPLYKDIVTSSIKTSGIAVYNFVFQNGEKSKNLNTISHILTVLAENEFTRTDIIVALGGGVVGDISGFAASIFLRGIKFIQIPTTLLACVDSSVGGKTGVDLPNGKNLVGTFYQPSLVLCDTATLKTLPKNIYAEGIAEAIKYGVICDKKLFDAIKNKTIDNEILIYSCIKIKADIVEKDEFDLGLRQLLNLGHTFAHAIEKLSNFNLSHGEAVSIGLVMSAEFSYKIGFGENISEEIIKALTAYDLPISSEQSKKDIFLAMQVDKKRRGDKISLILPKAIGETKIYEIETEKFKELYI